MRTPYTDTDNHLKSLLPKHPAPILQHAFQLASMPCKLFHYSRRLISASLWLFCPGGIDQPGVPIHHDGYVTSIQSWDGTTLRSHATIADNPAPFNIGDRIGVYAQNTGTDFDIKLRINGVTEATIRFHPHNTDCFATLAICFLRHM